MSINFKTNTIIANYNNFINNPLNKNLVEKTINNINHKISQLELKNFNINKDISNSVKSELKKSKLNKNKLNEEIEEIKSAISEYRIKRKNEEFDLNFKSIYNVINYKNSLINEKEEIKAFDYNTLYSKMTKTYNQKSFKSFKYFLFNISQKTNKITNKPLIDFIENNELFIDYKKSLTYDEDLNYSFKKEFIKGRHLEKVDNTYAMKKLAKVQYLESINKRRFAYFLTFTCPSHFHKYKMKDGIDGDERHYRDFSQLTLNENFNHRDYNFEDSIRDSIKLMALVNTTFSETMRKNLYKHFEKKARRITADKLSTMEFNDNKEKNRTKKLIYKETLEKIKYRRDKIRIIEPHKSMVRHSHYLQWINYEEKEVLFKTYEQIIKKFNLNRAFCKVIAIDKKRAKPTTYLTKYLTKNFSETKDIESNFYNIYKRYFCNEVKFFTTSDFKNTTQKRIDIMYSFLRKHCNNLLEEIRDKEISLYRYLDFLDRKKVFTFNEKKEIKYAFVKRKIKKLFNKYVRKEMKQIKTDYLEKAKEIKEKIKNFKSEKKELKNEYLRKLNNIKEFLRISGYDDDYNEIKKLKTEYYEIMKNNKVDKYINELKEHKKEFLQLVNDKKIIAKNKMKDEFLYLIKDMTKEYKYKYIDETFLNLDNRTSKIMNEYIYLLINSRYKFTTKKVNLLLTTPIKYNFKIQQSKLYEDRTITDIKYFENEINECQNVEFTEKEINHPNFNLGVKKKIS